MAGFLFFHFIFIIRFSPVVTSTAAPQFPSLPVQCFETQSKSPSLTGCQALGEVEHQHQEQHGLHSVDWGDDDDFLER